MLLNKNKTELIEIVKKNKSQIIILSIAAVVFVALSIGDGFTKTSDVNNEATREVYALENELEKKLEKFLETVEGVGKVKVCILFDLLEETSYAVNEERDSDEYASEYIIIENADGSEGGLSIRVRAPQVRGVAVSCEGATSAKVKNEVTDLLTAALGISANRVHVAPYSETK